MKDEIITKEGRYKWEKKRLYTLKEERETKERKCQEKITERKEKQKREKQNIGKY